MFENSLIVVNIKLDNARWFLRGLNKPFDPFAQKAMHDTMIGIANCTEAVWAYHIGNEIVLYLNPNAISRCKTMLSGMTRDNLVSYIASLTTVIFNLNYGQLMEKLDKCSNIEKIRLDNYKSKQYLARFDCAVRECDRDITPIIKTIKNTQEILYCKIIDGSDGYKVYNALSDADKYGEYFARTDIGAYTPIPTAKNIPRCRWTEGCFGAILGINSFLSKKSAFCKNLRIALAAD